MAIFGILYNFLYNDIIRFMKRSSIVISIITVLVVVILVAPSVTSASWLGSFSHLFRKSPVSQVNQKTSSSNAPSDSPLYSVVSVTDGDTIKVSIDGKVTTLRLIGMDTPETVDPRKVVQCFGREASAKAKELLTGKNVRLEADSTQGELDKYGRLLRYVYLEDGTFYNKFMISTGYAHEYTYQSNPYKYQTEFKDAERQARDNKLGLWSDSTCGGNTTQAASTQTVSVSKSVASAEPSNVSGEPEVKKSNTGICHERGVSPYYSKTKNYIPYSSVEECLASGGRLPKV